MLGMALVALPWRAALAVKQAAGRQRHVSRLGPVRPDDVIEGKSGAPAALTVFAAREKPWTDYQVIEYAGYFYEAIGKRLVARAGHHAYRYDFRSLEPGEVLRRRAPGGPPRQLRRRSLRQPA